MDIQNNLGKVYCGDALRLLRTMPVHSVHHILTDAMFGISRHCKYEWGLDPAMGDPYRHWLYHKPIYEECRRVLRPEGVLAWEQGAKFHAYFQAWFGDHRIWMAEEHPGRSRRLRRPPSAFQGSTPEFGSDVGIPLYSYRQTHRYNPRPENNH
jgi:hypothetical protein